MIISYSKNPSFSKRGFVFYSEYMDNDDVEEEDFE